MAEVTLPHHYLDAFGRLRVSNPSTVFDSKLLHDTNHLVWSEDINDASGSASATHITNRVEMAVGANASDRVIRQTSMRFNYLPGKSHLITMTCVVRAEAGVTKRVGYFNSSTSAPYTADRDGVWFEQDGLDSYWVLSRGGVETRVAQDDWDDPMNSAGDRYNFLVDVNAPQIIAIDLQWLGVGDVRCGFKVGTRVYVAHTFRNANDRDGTGIQEPYMESPNHSLRYEIYSDGAAGSLTEICGSVQSEGGYDLVGNLYSASRGSDTAANFYDTGNNTLVHPVMSLRLRSDRPDGTVVITSSSIVCTTTATYQWSLRLNPTIAGTDAASWVSVGGNSAVEYDVSRNNTNTVTGGTIVAGSYGADTRQSRGGSASELNSAVRPGIRINGDQDELVLCVQNVSSGSESYGAILNWREPL